MRGVVITGDHKDLGVENLTIKAIDNRTGEEIQWHTGALVIGVQGSHTVSIGQVSLEDLLYIIPAFMHTVEMTINNLPDQEIKKNASACFSSMILQNCKDIMEAHWGFEL